MYTDWSPSLLSRVEGPGLLQVSNQRSTWGKEKVYIKMLVKMVEGPGPI